jgi:hypothetical protein
MYPWSFLSCLSGELFLLSARVAVCMVCVCVCSIELCPLGDCKRPVLSFLSLINTKLCSSPTCLIKI